MSTFSPENVSQEINDSIMTKKVTQRGDRNTSVGYLRRVASTKICEAVKVSMIALTLSFSKDIIQTLTTKSLISNKNATNSMSKDEPWKTFHLHTHTKQSLSFSAKSNSTSSSQKICMLCFPGPPPLMINLTLLEKRIPQWTSSTRTRDTSAGKKMCVRSKVHLVDRLAQRTRGTSPISGRTCHTKKLNRTYLRMIIGRGKKNNSIRESKMTAMTLGTTQSQ